MTAFAKFASRVGLGDELGGVLARGVSAALLVRIAGMISGLLLYLVLARLLAPSGFGRYALALSWLNVLAMVATLGTDNAALRFVGEYRATGNWAGARGYQEFAARLSLIVGVGLALAAATIALNVLDREAAYVFIVAFAAIPLIAQIAQRQAVLRAYGAVVSGLMPEQVVRPLAIVVLVAVVVLFTPQLTPISAAACLLTGTFGSFLLGRWLLTQRQPVQFAQALPLYEVRQWLGTALRLGVFSWAYTLFRQLDLLMVGSLSSSHAAGVYAVATRCADVAIFVVLAIDTILAPMVAGLHAQGDRARLGLLVRRAARVALLLSLSACVLLWLTGPWLLAAFGPDYVRGYGTLAILVAGQLLGVACGYGPYLLTMTGREVDALAVLLAALTVDCIANLLLIPPYGNAGAAWATVLAAVVWRVGSALIAWLRIGINPLPFGPMLRAAP